MQQIPAVGNSKTEYRVHQKVQPILFETVSFEVFALIINIYRSSVLVNSTTVLLLRNFFQFNPKITAQNVFELTLRFLKG